MGQVVRANMPVCYIATCIGKKLMQDEETMKQLNGGTLKIACLLFEDNYYNSLIPTCIISYNFLRIQFL